MSNPEPSRVTERPAVGGEFGGACPVSTRPSYENDLSLVPVYSAVVTISRRLCPPPGVETRQLSEVSEFQLVVAHNDGPSLALDVKSALPRPVPMMVTENAPLVGPFQFSWNVITGESKVNIERDIVPHRPFLLMLAKTVRRRLDGASCCK